MFFPQAQKKKSFVFFLIYKKNTYKVNLNTFKFMYNK